VAGRGEAGIFCAMRVMKFGGAALRDGAAIERSSALRKA
jgi:hypothetical protein